MNQFAKFAAQVPLLLVMTPLVGVGLLAVMGRKREGLARQAVLVNAALSVLLSVALAGGCFSGTQGLDLLRQTSQVVAGELPFSGEGLGGPGLIRVHLSWGLNGVNLAPLLIVPWISWFCLRACAARHVDDFHQSARWLLLGQASATALFAVQDLLGFLVCCELWSGWSFLAIGQWGTADRRTAAGRNYVVSCLAQACWSLATIGLAVSHYWIQLQIRGSQVVSFLYLDVIAAQARWITGNQSALEIWQGYQDWILALWLLGLLLRWPMLPTHGGVRGAITEGSAPVSSLVSTASILQAGYVWFQFVMPLFSPAASDLFWVTLLLTTWGGIYFAALALRATSPRGLIACLTLWSLQGAWLLSLSESVIGSLIGWQAIISTALLTTAAILLSERQIPDSSAVNVPRSQQNALRRFLLTVTLACLAGWPAAGLISGRWIIGTSTPGPGGLANLAFLLSGVIALWAVIKTMIPDHQVDHRESEPHSWACAPGILLIPVLVMFLFPNLWQAALRPTWETLHDPFSQSAAPAVLPATEPERLADSQPRQEPPRSSSSSHATGFPWQIAATMWIVGGVGLLLMPKGWLTPSAGWLVSMTALSSGAVAGVLLDISSSWERILSVTLSLAGLCQFLTLFPRSRSLPVPVAGAWLLRIGAIAWVSVSNNLILLGLGWELAELSRWMESAGRDHATPTDPRERIRYLISSCCFWGGIGCCWCMTGETQVADVARHFREQLSLGNEGGILRPSSWIGVSMTVLWLSAIGSRAGLLPWSFGSDDRSTELRVGPSSVNAWIRQWLAIVVLERILIVASAACKGPLSVMLTIAAVLTALWSVVTVIGEEKVAPTIRALLQCQFAGLVLMFAVSAAQGTPLADASIGSPPGFDVLPWLGRWCLSVSAALWGLCLLLRSVGEPTQSTLFFEHYRGLWEKQRLAACLLIAMLAVLAIRVPWASGISGWLALTGLVLVRQPGSPDAIQANSVLLAGAAIWLFAGTFLWAKLAGSFRCWIFEPAVALPVGTQPNVGKLAAALIALCMLLAGLFPKSWFLLGW